MNPNVESVLRDYAARIESESQLMRQLSMEDLGNRRDELLLAVGPDTGALLNTLVKASKAKNILEIGTSYGYSTVWLAEAAAAIGGTVTTLEVHAGKAEFARSQLAKAGLASRVDVRVGDATQTLPALSGPFDFVLLDLWKDLYIPCFDLVYPKLSAGALIVADNMLQPERVREVANAYRAHVRSKQDMTSVLLEVGSGLELSRYR